MTIDKMKEKKSYPRCPDVGAIMSGGGSSGSASIYNNDINNYHHYKLQRQKGNKERKNERKEAATAYRTSGVLPQHRQV